MNIRIMFLLLLSLPFVVFAQQKSIEKIYTKQNYMVEMRDGTKLYTVIYTPNDVSKKHPILITRTPYGSSPYEANKFRRFPEHLVNENFIFVYQDVRGKFMSEGKYVNMRPYIPNKSGKQIDEASDTYDTIEWLINNIPNNNGNVGIYGISYPGFYAAMSLNDSHPALKAVSPQAPIADWFVGDDMHHNGAFTLSLSYIFFSTFGVERPKPTTSWSMRIVDLSGNSYNYFLNIGTIKNVNKNYFYNDITFWNDFTQHGTYDKFWKSRNTLNHFEKVAPAVMTVGGWFDGEDLYGALNTYKTIEKKNPNADNILVVGPWPHGGWARSDGSSFGNMTFDSNTSEYYQNDLELKFFQKHLENKTDIELPEISVFETGTNKWNTFGEWPPNKSEELNIYFSGNSELKNSVANTGVNYSEYISNPSSPVPYTAKFHRTETMYNKTYMVEDQRFASARPDVILFEGKKLEENITLAGPIEVELYVSTTGTDSDWIVKLIDVYPNKSSNSSMDNFQMLVRGEIMRGKFRNSLEEPEAFVPGKVTKVKFIMNDSHHTFLKGHKIMVQVQSSWFPLFDRNPQTFCDIYNADENDFVQATQRVYHSAEYPSKIILKVLK